MSNDKFASANVSHILKLPLSREKKILNLSCSFGYLTPVITFVNQLLY